MKHMQQIVTQTTFSPSLNQPLIIYLRDASMQCSFPAQP